ncbi:TIGR03087 family PEP-CTERM/XrtA system glycosyltransferase [Accumulibacter sp.]|uniref:TIGR03087 family PEP-CTERM/XrtA system glycosyltransferase n=1 Tax=Accumulibacter sp. TaxID=2053492 RepID=UPI0025E3B932|nr:TIGR03087 family PEP-CTERM/XrtA system glycosyltransferase [Accumulibacter sp.]MCM8595401.1 TIGR03087 family PEP-CTERM/XrtA system glycosyltransferase [Accumulibacter sp.]MCM8626418.1 TIGR03087 family PEP-CTERM/XrtA system glycosyltransferase [Accumulibacter sp.]MDS4049548.1 TIGR03087 family PEP-CTERM/XrtA system glycosyltransferase [Accumulibacter sp.]
MSNLLYLVHRLPYPPNKGDKVRSFHLLKHLAERHRVFLATFIDDPQDDAYLDTVAGYCAEMHAARLVPAAARIRSLSGLARRSPLTLPYYRSGELQRWVDRVLSEHRIDAAVVFSSAMAQFVEGSPRLRRLVDFVDVDSAKWTQYATNHCWPLSWLYRREGERLLSFERSVALGAERCFFVTEPEADLFRHLAPDCADKVEAIGNGVDADYFSPAHEFPSPFAENEIPLVFTGAMDYWPNVDAVTWFAAEVLPRLQTDWPTLRFNVVGRSPAPAVQALAGPGISVTGTVPDVRPYLRHAAAVVAPLRLARGVQNKILEAMAMGLPVVASKQCAGAIDAVPGWDFLAAGAADEYVAEVGLLLSDRQRAAAIGSAARECVLARYSWNAHLSRIDRHLDA